MSGMYSKWKDLPLGEHLVICDRHGGLTPASQIRMERTQEGGTSYAVCESCWDRVQPQEYVRGVAENLTPKLPIRPENLDFEFMAVCTNNSAVAGIAIASCAIAGNATNTIFTNPADEGDFTAANSVDLN